MSRFFLIIFLIVLGSVCAPSAHAYVQQLTSVRINPASLSSLSIGDTTYLSTLGFDQFGNPIFSGLTYEWGLSSTGSLGTLTADKTGKTAILKVSSNGHGDLYVIAKQGAAQVTNSMLVRVGSSALAGDINGDNTVNINDYTLLSQSFFKQGSAIPVPEADINSDGIVDLKDYTILVGNFFTSL